MSHRVTLSGEAPDPNCTDGAPQPIDPATGMHRDYWVLSAEERAKGLVRPVRRSYKHVGAAGPRYPLRDLTPDEQARHAPFGYVKFEAYPESESPRTGSYWTQARLDAVGKGCGRVTAMGFALAETYAREPTFYGSTFCTTCRVHRPVGAAGEFTWADDHGADTGFRVGT